MANSTEKKAGPAGRPPRPATAPRRRLGIVVLVVLGLLLAGLALWWEYRRVGRQARRQAGLLLVEARHFHEAEPFLLQALQHRPDDVEVLAALVLAQTTIGRLFTEIEPHLTRWCDLQPHNAEPYRLRMGVWARLSQRDRSLADGIRVLELEPDNDEVRRAVIWLLLATNRLEEARQECARGLSQRPKDPEFRYQLAKAHHFQGQQAQAAALLDTLLAEHRAYTPALLLRGILHREMNQPEKAIGPLRKVAAEDPDSANRQAARYHLSQALARTGQTQEAEAVMRAFQRQQTAEQLVKDGERQLDNLEMQVRVAEALLGSDRPEQGAHFLERLLERVPQCKAAHRLLAGFYEKKGETARAQRHRRLADSTP